VVEDFLFDELKDDRRHDNLNVPLQAECAWMHRHLLRLRRESHWKYSDPMHLGQG